MYAKVAYTKVMTHNTHKHTHTLTGPRQLPDRIMVIKGKGEWVIEDDFAYSDPHPGDSPWALDYSKKLLEN